MPREGAERLSDGIKAAEEIGWAEPDLAVLRLHRRPPPELPLHVFGPWAPWITSAAQAAACPPDYVVAPLLASASALIGNARWAQATPGWAEPPHLWDCSVGDSGAGKSPGSDCLLRNVVPRIEAKMATDFPDHFDRLRELDLHRQGEVPEPVMVPLAAPAQTRLETFGLEMQEKQSAVGGLLCSAYGKARGQALRLALVLEFMWWCGKDSMNPPPIEITERAFIAAAHLVADYFMLMAERVYGDAAIPTADRNAATLARWIKSKRPDEVYVRHLQREVRLPGLNTADVIHAAAAVLVEADWLLAPRPATGFGLKRREAYAINPRLWEVLR